MEPKRAAGNRGRIIVGVTLAAALVGGGAASYLVWGGNDPVAPTGAGTTTGTSVLSAEEGAAARARLDQYRAGTATGGGAGAVEAAGAKLSADAALPIECGPGDGGTYEPSPEDIAAANADTDALAATFDTFGIAHSRVTDSLGFAYLEWDTFDVVAQSVADSFWADRYPVEPPSPEELDRVRAENDVVVEHLQNAGFMVTRTTDANGWESLAYDYEDPAAQEAVNAAYAELYPPVPPAPAELAAAKADNDKLAAAFDEAGIAYTRVSDALGWEWLDWDYDDPDTQAKVDAVFNQLYPPVGLPCLVAEGDGLAGAGGGLAGEDGKAGEAETPVPAGDGAVEADGAGAVLVAEEITVDPAGQPTAEQAARRDAEAAALVAGFEAAAVIHQLVGESPWQSVTFDLTNPASVPVVAGVLAARG